jgi:hypothetical protein
MSEITIVFLGVVVVVSSFASILAGETTSPVHATTADVMKGTASRIIPVLVDLTEALAIVVFVSVDLFSLFSSPWWRC